MEDDTPIRDKVVRRKSMDMPDLNVDYLIKEINDYKFTKETMFIPKSITTLLGKYNSHRVRADLPPITMKVFTLHLYHLGSTCIEFPKNYMKK